MSLVSDSIRGRDVGITSTLRGWFAGLGLTTSQIFWIQVSTNPPHFHVCFSLPAEMKPLAALTSSLPGIKCLAPKKMVVQGWFVPESDTNVLTPLQGQVCAYPEWDVREARGAAASRCSSA